MEQLTNSFKKNKIGIILIIITALMTSLGQVCWKLGQGETTQLIYILIGFVFYGVGTILMILAFKYGSFSVLHPLLACGYIFALIWSKIFLNERITGTQILGIIFIIVAVGFIGGGDE
ncbi:MAG: EamA family transporter [Clostridiales bacterium]|nr:EamA family transporter [Clostridiales bacterium]